MFDDGILPHEHHGCWKASAVTRQNQFPQDNSFGFWYDGAQTHLGRIVVDMRGYRETGGELGVIGSNCICGTDRLALECLLVAINEIGVITHRSKLCQQLAQRQAIKDDWTRSKINEIRSGIAPP